MLPSPGHPPPTHSGPDLLTSGPHPALLPSPNPEDALGMLSAQQKLHCGSVASPSCQVSAACASDGSSVNGI